MLIQSEGLIQYLVLTSRIRKRSTSPQQAALMIRHAQAVITEIIIFPNLKPPIKTKQKVVLKLVSRKKPSPEHLIKSNSAAPLVYVNYDDWLLTKSSIIRFNDDNGILN